MTTFDDEKSKKTQKKWRRGDSRGILSAAERETLIALREERVKRIDRHKRFVIHYKTKKAIEDLALIFSTKTQPIDVRPLTNDFYPPVWFDQYLKDLLRFYYEMHYFILLTEKRSIEREEGNTNPYPKVRITKRELWQSVRKDLRTIIASIQEDQKIEAKRARKAKKKSKRK